MASSKPAFIIPPGDQVITVKLINPVNAGPAILSRFMAPPIPGVTEFKTFPSFSFLLEHTSGRKLVFDLGIRKDYQNYAPKIAEYIPTTKYTIQVEKNVIDILEENGIKGKDIEAVIWSHWHWDHIGDPSTFPLNTDLIVGPGFKENFFPGAPRNIDSPILESDYEGRTLREINFDQNDSLAIGRFKAFDYFGDGSFYILDSPGHAIGHLCGLARTTMNPDSFILLGGDICHYAGIFRPSPYLPVPTSISPHPFDPSSSLSFCPGGVFEKLQQSRGRACQDPVYSPTFGYDIPLAIKTTEKLQEADASDDIFVIIAHDSTVRDSVEHFPASLNEWKSKGWGRDLKWAFFRDLEPCWKMEDAAESVPKNNSPTCSA